jgi:hypothetical protein
MILSCKINWLKWGSVFFEARTEYLDEFFEVKTKCLDKLQLKRLRLPCLCLLLYSLQLCPSLC